MVRLTVTFYLTILGCDCDVCMLMSMVLLSNEFEDKKYEQIYADACRKILVLRVSDHPCALSSKKISDHEEEDDSNES